ncbi:hypothetical protein UFOVP112_176 [uncultured Caudovirales phage]|uniref:Uncharacterized protein n=1 Tax=uncultured Caudovirales phage TaxID=2100421 RepID=A0A6J5L2Y8_9CAUD|nr:hypothetical protein UFOVP112_176 [uncultured Caudovirales phage]
MSKNHPNDNIYSILGKLEALKPTPEEKRFALVKEIQESVEAQGSILEGVDAVEARLAQQFAESIDEKAPPGAKAERMVKDIKKGYAKDGKLTDKEKAIAYATTWKAHNKGQVEEAGAVCAECGMVEGECEHTMAEGEVTHKGGEKVATKTGTIHKSKATVDTEKLLSRGDVTDPDAEEVPSAPAVKQGRGRPKMAAKDRSQASMPWGGNPPKDTYKHQKGSLVHKISESRLMDDAGQTLQHILNRFRAEVRNFEQGGDLDEDLYHALFDYYNDAGEMPYGVAKARDGDPMEWVAQNLESHLRGGGVVGGNQEDDYSLEREAIGEPQPGIPGNIPVPGKMDRLNNPRDYYEEVTMEDELNELARLAGLQTEGNAFSGKLANTSKGDSFEQDGKTFTNRSSIANKELDEEETDEGNEFGQAVRNAKADGVQPGEKVKVGGKEIPVKESTELDGEQSDFNISTSMSSDGNKNVTVTATGDHAANLLQMLRIAGLGGGDKAQELQQQEPEVMYFDEPDAIEMDEEGVEVDQPAQEPANAPDEKYGSIKAITTQGDDLNREKSQDPATANKAANPLTNAQSVLKAVAQLESKLAEEYESIKKVSK